MSCLTISGSFITNKIRLVNRLPFKGPFNPSKCTIGTGSDTGLLTRSVSEAKPFHVNPVHPFACSESIKEVIRSPHVSIPPLRD